MNENPIQLPELLLTKGDSGPAVAEVHQRLARLGYLEPSTPAEDTQGFIFDAELDKATRVFQIERGINSDGVVGPITFKRLEEARWELGDRVLSYSFSHMTAGDDVLSLQQRLNDLGFNAGRIDGVFGPDTDKAVREFQRNVGVEADGTCGPTMWQALDRLSRAVTGGASNKLRSALFHDVARTGVANKVVVLDPGHGGPDHGILANRLAESIVADDLSRRIEGRLAALGTQVLITRPMSFELEEELDEASRAQFANETGADLVVSLHTNNDLSPQAHGVSTYYYGHSRGGSELGSRFAELVLDEIVTRTDLSDCRSHAKTWDLLRMTRMPAVRIETGFVTNPHDASRLADAAFRDALADAIANAVVEFFSPETSDD